MYLKGYDLENSKNMLLHHFDNLLPYTVQSKMATRHNYLKSLKLQSHCMQINFIFTVRTNLMLPSLLPSILRLFCFSFILLFTFYLHFIFCFRYLLILTDKTDEITVYVFKLVGVSVNVSQCVCVHM